MPQKPVRPVGACLPWSYPTNLTYLAFLAYVVGTYLVVLVVYAVVVVVLVRQGVTLAAALGVPAVLGAAALHAARRLIRTMPGH
jgi:hypothetical protein